MEEVVLRVLKEPKVRNPIFVEGLPGVGNVGKLAAEHLIDELKAVRFAEIHSKDFPPQVFVLADGTIKLVDNSLYYFRASKKDQRDLVLLTGDYQGLSSQGQYEIVDKVLALLQKHGVRELFTLGGYGLGRMVANPGVLGAATSADLVKRMKKLGVQFREDEPGGGIVGASGLFLGLGKLRGMDGVCLMGETSGYLVDPKSAQAVLEILCKSLKVTVRFDSLENKAREMDRVAQQLRDLERKSGEKSGEELRYIG
ncbi:MAG TPA: proteasome assembly chaperone family protein [Candidatus Thermoplasmatota archaeon]|nr:proteasome assembly chaperone family protein [Candidatus Thermoplasmatota archaeon]